MAASQYLRPQPNQPAAWLGGLTPTQFMSRHWQKRPLLVRGAFPGFKPPVSIAEVLRLCTNDLAQSRLVTRRPASGKKKTADWALEHGPFRKRDLPKITDPNWTVLVQQVNTLLPAADRFMDAFRFIPEARLDDLMISIAGPEGGIGAHVDSYDVFLIQAAGQRRWEIAEDFDPTLQPNVPLKILQSFRAEHDWVLDAGDLLYLPPDVAHRGTAVGSGCMTWSVGFRAPSTLALADQAWAQHLDGLEDANWQDPWLQATEQPGKIPDRLLSALTRKVLQALPGRRAVQTAVAQALSEPAPAAVFNVPQRPPGAADFRQQACKHGLRLSPASRLLYAKGEFFMNGEHIAGPGLTATGQVLEQLADSRRLSAADVTRGSRNSELMSLLLGMHRNGWIVYD